MKQELLYITQGSTYLKDIAAFNADGTPLDMTGYTASMSIAKYFGSTTKFAVPVTVANAVGGILRISVSDAGTALLPHGSMVYSIFITPPDGERTLLLQGSVIIIPTV